MGAKKSRSDSPQRTCLGCREQHAASDLVRYVLREGGQIVAGRTLLGRGAWICPTSECHDQVRQTNGFARAFRATCQADVSIWEQFAREFAAQQATCKNKKL